MWVILRLYRPMIGSCIANSGRHSRPYGMQLGQELLQVFRRQVLQQ
jgi:hypothetical protein